MPMMKDVAMSIQEERRTDISNSVIFQLAKYVIHLSQVGSTNTKVSVTVASWREKGLIKCLPQSVTEGGTLLRCLPRSFIFPSQYRSRPVRVKIATLYFNSPSDSCLIKTNFLYTSTNQFTSMYTAYKIF